MSGRSQSRPAASLASSRANSTSPTHTQRSLSHEFQDAGDLVVKKMYYAEDRVDTLSNIQMLQWYILAAVAVDINLGKIQKRADTCKSVYDAYVKKCDGVAGRYWTFMLDERGGKKPLQWIHNRDVAWLDKRLQYRDNECSHQITGEYLWSQWQDQLRPQLEAEAMVAWNLVTSNGTNLVVSGGDAMTIHDRFLQAWYETNADRSKSKKNPSTVKEENADKWKKFAPEDPRASVCPLPQLGHGEECPYGRAPPKHAPPKAYLAFIAMGPIADLLADYYSEMEEPEGGWFPTFHCEPAFQQLLGTNKTKGGPPATDPKTGGASKETSSVNLSRQSARDADLEDDDSDSLHASLKEACKTFSATMAPRPTQQTDADLLNAQVNLINAAVNVQPGSKAHELVQKLLDKQLNSV